MQAASYPYLTLDQSLIKLQDQEKYAISQHPQILIAHKNPVPAEEVVLVQMTSS